MLTRQQLLALSGPGLYGRKHAGSIHRRLREVVLPDGHTNGEHAATRAGETTQHIRQWRAADPDSTNCRSRVMNRSVERRAPREPALSEVEGSSTVVAGRGRPALH